MAEACRLRSSRFNESNNSNNDQNENFSVFNALCVFISLITILADLATDVLVFAEYLKDGFIYWSLATLIFILTPNILINVFSMRWFVIDKKANVKHWVLHGFLSGLFERYMLFLKNVFACQKSGVTKTQKLISERNDLSLLHILYIFTGTMPQIILQTYSVLTSEGNYDTKVFAVAASSASVIWGCVTYIHSIMAFSSENFQWISFILRLFWHFNMLVARVWGVVLFTLIFGVWILLPFGLHWAAMTFWIVIQNTTFCPNKLEETLYNVVMGFVYCFSYINLREGHTRYRLMMFYTFMVTQNFGSLFLYVLLSDSDRQRKPWSICATTCIIAGTILGICCMICYYRYFHSKGPILWKITNNEEVELNNKVTSNKPLKHVRSFKTTEKENLQCKNGSIRNEMPNIETAAKNEFTGKNNLLENWIARSISPNSTSVSTRFVNLGITDAANYSRDDKNLDEKLSVLHQVTSSRPPTEQKLSSFENIESSIDEITSHNLKNMQKRRGICFPYELRDELTDLNLEACNRINEAFDKAKTDHHSEIGTDDCNKKTSSDSIDMDLDLSLSDINSSDINTFNENIVQKLCLSALKNIKVGNQDADIQNIQKIAVDILKEMYDKKGKHENASNSGSILSKQRDLGTPTELLSVHDYENICAVNIAREAWGLRSWNGYVDIENWIHDGSVVRDRRRDTLTSASTEISSCISQELKNAIMNVSPFTKRSPTYSNVFVKFHDYVNTSTHASICNSNDETFLAKSGLVENKDLTQLEPIIEELDNFGDIDPATKKRLNSESSLVATIDEIRKTTVANSPSDVPYRVQLWDSHHYSPSKLDSNLKRALWKEPSKFDSSNIMKSLPEKELGIPCSKFDLSKKNNVFSSVTALENVQSTSGTQTTKRRIKNLSNLKYQNKNSRQLMEQYHQDLFSKDIDLLWQKVTENSTPIHSTEDLQSTNKISSSLQSLIQNDTLARNTSLSKTTNIKKGVKGRPRRKFSILRERFEPKPNTCSDEEILYNSSKGRTNLGFVDVRNTMSKDGIQSRNLPTCD